MHVYTIDSVLTIYQCVFVHVLKVDPHDLHKSPQHKFEAEVNKLIIIRQSTQKYPMYFLCI